MASKDVFSVNRTTKEVLLEDGTVIPIVILYDNLGDETDDMEEATVAVIEHKDQSWSVVILSEFDQTPTLQ